VASGTATTYGTRFHIWGLALRGLVHHPLLGIGPGQVISLIAPHVSASFAAHLGPGTLPYDSHDFVIEVLATTGILGFLAFAAWGGGAACKARGPFLACAIAILAVELIEPLNVGVTPVALLALGAATVTLAGEPVGLAAFRQWRHHREVVVSEGATSAAGHSGVRTDADTTAAENGRRLQPATVITGLLVVASLFLGGTMVLGDHYLFISAGDAQAAPKIASASDANRLLPYWPDSAVAVAEGYQNASNISGSGSGPLKEALRWYLIAADRDPADPSLRDTTADIELQLGNRPAARQQELTALQRDPWTYFALEGLGTIEQDSGNWQASLSWYKKALMVAPASNDLERLISSDEAHLRPD
jgi:hypothetical protein